MLRVILITAAVVLGLVLFKLWLTSFVNIFDNDGPGTIQRGAEMVYDPRPGGMLSQEACDRWEPSKENRADSKRFVIQVLYVYPSDRPDRMKKIADMIQGDAQFTDSLYIGRSKGRSRLAWDTGGPCGIKHLDIRSIQTDRKAAWYKSKDIDTIYDDTDFFLRSVLKEENKTTPKIYLGYLDGMLPSKDSLTLGMSYTLEDDSPGLGNANIYYPAISLIAGDSNNPEFFARQSDAFLYRRHSVAHELTHSLGAVSESAPHYYRNKDYAGHCSDGYDLMCYGLVGDQTSAGEPVCRGYTFVLDCGLNDYFNPYHVPEGSFLDTHWNIANSPYLLTGELRESAI